MRIALMITLILWILPSWGQTDPDYLRDRWLSIAEACKPNLIEKAIHPAEIVGFEADRTAFQGWSVKRITGIDSLYNTSFKKIKDIIVDFGNHYTGYFSFDLETLYGSADGPLRFRLTFGEVPSEVAVPFDPYPGTLSRAWLQDEVITVMDVPATVTLDRRMAFRYLRIELLGSSPYFDFRISDMHCLAVTSAVSEPEPLAETASPLIRKIDRIGQKTLSECMQTVYEDGPKRDRRLWVGDLYLEALANNCSFKNHNLTKRCLYLLAGLSDEEGIILGTVFETPEPHPQVGQRLLDYALLYNVALSEYVKTTGDIETGTDLWPLAKRQINIAENYLGEKGLIDFDRASRDWWIFVDWKEGLQRHAAIQGIMIYSLKQTWELARMVDREEEVKYIPELIEKMQKASRDNFYNRKTGLFESGPDRQVSFASQVWMVLAGVAGEKESRKSLEGVVEYPGALAPGAPYMYHFVIQALINSGLYDMAKQSLEEYWGGMVRKGADTFWEVYDPNDDFISPYNFYPVNSYCHAWSCTPVYFIRKYPAIFQK